MMPPVTELNPLPLRRQFVYALPRCRLHASYGSKTLCGYHTDDGRPWQLAGDLSFESVNCARCVIELKWLWRKRQYDGPSVEEEIGAWTEYLAHLSHETEAHQYWLSDAVCT